MTDTFELANSTFSNVEEIGPRLKLLRLHSRKSVSSVAGTAGISYITVEAVEKGSGSPWSLEQTAAALGATLSIKVTLPSGQSTFVEFAELQGFIKSYRTAMKISHNNLATRAGVQSSSVKTFESSKRPSLKSINRYLQALNIRTDIQILVNGVAETPSRDETMTFLTAEGAVKKTHGATKAQSEDLARAIGGKLEASRVEAGLTKADTARIAGVAQLTVAKVEKQGGSLMTMTRIAEAVDRRLVFTLTDVKGAVIELPADQATEILDQLREAMGVDYSTMARRMGTSYRTIRVFNDAERNSVFAVERYAKALGFELGFRME